MTPTNINEIVPLWWYFDNQTGALIYEVEKNGKKIYKNEIARVFPTSYEALVGQTSHEELLLWSSREISLENTLVTKLINWNLYGLTNGEPDNEWRFNIYLAREKRIHWIKDPEGAQGIDIEGNLRGTQISNSVLRESIRLFVPLRNGNSIAISERDRPFYLCGAPLDNDMFHREVAEREKAVEKAARKAARIAAKQARAQKKLAGSRSHLFWGKKAT